MDVFTGTTHINTDIALFRNQPNSAALPSRARLQTVNTILIVDDNEINLRLLEALIKGIGRKCERAMCGTEALNLLSDKKYAMVLMDICMPEMDGIEITRRLRENKSGPNAKTPVIAVTAMVLEDVPAKCFDAGMQGFIPKPLTMQNLLDICAEHMDSLGEVES